MTPGILPTVLPECNERVSWALHERVKTFRALCSYILDCTSHSLRLPQMHTQNKTGNFQGDHAPRPPYNRIANHILRLLSCNVFFLAGEEPGLASFPGVEKGEGKRSAWCLLYAHVH